MKTNCNYDKYCNKKNWSARLNFELPAAQSAYRKSYIKPLPRRGGAYLFQAYLKRRGEGGLNGDADLIWEVGFINLETTMVLVLHKELEYKAEKLKYKTF